MSISGLSVTGTSSRRGLGSSHGHGQPSQTSPNGGSTTKRHKRILGGIPGRGGSNEAFARASQQMEHNARAASKGLTYGHQLENMLRDGLGPLVRGGGEALEACFERRVAARGGRPHEMIFADFSAVLDENKVRLSGQQRQIMFDRYGRRRGGGRVEGVGRGWKG